MEACTASEGIGETSADLLAREVLYRRFTNRRQLASCAGPSPMPYQSGTWTGIGGSAGPATRGQGRPSSSCAWLWLRYPARQCARRVVSARVGALARRAPADRHRRDGAQAADRALALCPDRAAAGGCRARGIGEIAAGDAVIGGNTGSATVFVIGSVKPPRLGR